MPAATGTLADHLRTAARQTPDRVLVVDGDIRLDCATLDRQARALAGSLSSRMPTGSVVSFMLPNWYEAAVVYLGATLAGMVVNPILPSLRDHELTFILADVGSRMIFIPREFRGHDYSAMLRRVVTAVTDPPDVVVVRGGAGEPVHTPYATLLEPPPDRPVGAAPSDPGAIRMVMYTSGTTGRPKGVLHSHHSLHALIDQIREHWHVAPDDTFLVPSPIAHIGGSIYAFEMPLLAGTTAVLMERWDPDDAVALMGAERCTHMAGATPFLSQLLDAARRAGTRLPDLKVFICGGASVPPSLIHTATEFFDNAVVSRVYGSTEVPVTTVGSTRAGDVAHAAGTDGRAGIADIKLVDGEIRAKGPQMLVGYLHPDDNLGAFDEHGYFRTGDLGTWVDDDYLMVTGRAKDLIIRNGENISPKEIEDLLIVEAGIAEVAIVGVPDPITGERACAVIVPGRGPAPDVDAIARMLAARGVARFKVPERVEIWDALPRNDAGKVLKHQIRAQLMQHTEAETRSGRCQ